MKKQPLFIALCSVFVLLCGCAPAGSRQAELNQSTGRLLPVSALALDKTASGYTMTVESIRQDSLDGDAAPAYFSVEANDFDALFDRADRMLPSRLYLMHARTVIVSPAIAEGALNALTDSLLRRPDARLTLRVAVAHGKTPDEILRAEAISAGIPGVALADLLDQRSVDGSTADAPLIRILDCQTTGLPYTLPVLTLSTDGHAAPDGSVRITTEGLIYLPRGDEDA